jgi:hypothetical protein
MAKAKLTALTKEWIDNKTESHIDIKAEKHNNIKTDDDKIRQTIYISRAINKKLWLTRIETGNSISSIVSNLVTKHLNNN